MRIVVYECVVRTKEVSGNSCSAPVHYALSPSKRVTLGVERSRSHNPVATTHYIRWNSTVMADLSLQGTVIHAHRRYNAFEELFVALHRALPVRSIPTISILVCEGVILGALSS